MDVQTSMEIDHVTDIQGPVRIVQNDNNEVQIISDENHGTQSDFQDVEEPDYNKCDTNLAISNSNSPINDSTKTNTYDNDEDGSICPICLDNWTNSGEQRICSLKCGHVFCHKCVVRWLDSQQQKSCPTCKKKAQKSDIRYIYVKKLIAIDNSELEELRQKLNLVIEEKHKIQIDLSKYICREGILKQNISQLETQIQDLISRSSGMKYNGEGSISNSKLDSSNFSSKLYMEKSLEICKQNGCRVFDFSTALDLIMVSAKSTNTLFTGYGVRKVNMSQYKPLAFIPLHQQQIRDISFQPAKNCLLTVSMDKSFKVTDLLSNKVLFTSSLNMPLWSCCWSRDNQHHLYVGTQAGTLVKYDLRNLGNPISTLSIPGDMSPVVSVASISSGAGTEFPLGGVISCKLNSMWVFENQGEEYVKHSLSLNGPFVSMKLHHETCQLLVSSRPNNLVTHSRHSLCTLGKTLDGALNCNIIHTFSGGGMQKLLSKSCFVNSDKEEYVAAYEESNKSVLLWSINTGQKLCSLPAREAVLDLKGVQMSSGNFLISLTERKMEFFKFI